MLRASKFFAFLLTFLLSLQSVAADHKSAQKRIEELLADPEVARAVWGIEVVDLAQRQDRCTPLMPTSYSYPLPTQSFSLPLRHLP